MLEICGHPEQGKAKAVRCRDRNWSMAEVAEKGVCDASVIFIVGHGHVQRDPGGWQDREFSFCLCVAGFGAL